MRSPLFILLIVILILFVGAFGFMHHNTDGFCPLSLSAGANCLSGTGDLPVSLNHLSANYNLINVIIPSFLLFLFLLFVFEVARQRLEEKIHPIAALIRKGRRIIPEIIFFAQRIVLYPIVLRERLVPEYFFGSA